MIFKDEDKEDANKLAVAMGHCPEGADAYTVPLSIDGNNPITHWLCHSWCVESFAQMLYGVSQGTLPEPDLGRVWEDFGLTAQRVGSLMAAAIVSCKDGADPQTHVTEILESNNLQKYVA
jgi:hypothetical protein